MNLLTLRNATPGYGRCPVLRNISFGLPSGSLCCLLGANGSGKTTLMRSILGVLPLSAGEILLDGIPINRMSERERATAIAWVPQAHDGVFAFKVIDMVMMGCAPHMAVLAVPGVRERKRSLRQLRELGIGHLADRDWNTLSGGERQLVFICRALVQQPRLLLLDEPASSLDFGHQITLLNTLRLLKQSGMTLLMSTHHPLHARAIADTVLCIEPDGQISRGPAEIQLTARRLATLYGVTPSQIKYHLRIS